jgi:hypothetical protein
MRVPKGNGVTLSERRKERGCAALGSGIYGFPQHNWAIVRDDGLRVEECVRCGETVTWGGAA